MPEARKYEFYRILLALRQEEIENRVLNIVQLPEARWTDDNLSDAAYFADWYSCLPEALVDVEGGEPNMEEIRRLQSHRVAVKNGLKQAIEIHHGNQLRALHAMAQGMLAQFTGNWEEYFPRSNPHVVTHFLTAVQGTIFRRTLVNAFQTEGCYSGQLRKVRWLKEWILDEDEGGASMEELRKLLRFITKFPALGRGVQISVGGSQRTLPFPGAQTCMKTIYIADANTAYGQENDHTKEAFIRCVKASIDTVRLQNEM